MSDLYIRRLGRIGAEYQAAAGALSYVTVHLHTQSIFSIETTWSILVAPSLP